MTKRYTAEQVRFGIATMEKHGYAVEATISANTPHSCFGQPMTDDDIMDFAAELRAHPRFTKADLDNARQKADELLAGIQFL